MFLPLLTLAFVLALDLAKGNFSESTLELMTSLVRIFGISLITLLGAFFKLMNEEVSRQMGHWATVES